MKTTLLFLGGVGMQEILVIGLVILVFFGAKKIPEFMKGLGKGVREFKDGVKDMKNDMDDPAPTSTTLPPKGINGQSIRPEVKIQDQPLP
jgi:sec-independent protein translocase protein TatA